MLESISTLNLVPVISKSTRCQVPSQKHLSNYIYGYKEIKTKKDGSQEEEDVVVSYDKSFKNIISTKDPSLIDTNNFLENKIKVYNFKHLGVNDHNADNVAFAILFSITQSCTNISTAKC